MDRYIPKYMNEKRSVIQLVLGTSIFAFLFIITYQPFDSRNWVDQTVSDLVYFAFSGLIILTALCVLAISRVIMYHFAKKHDITLIGYLLWVLAEIFSMSFVYTLFPIFVLKVKTPPFFDLLKTSIAYTTLVVFIPYVILTLYFAFRNKDESLQLLHNKITGEDGNLLSKESLPKSNLISFYDEKGELRLSVGLENLYYIESADNYVNIYYQNKGKIENFMLRNTLKYVETTFRDRNLVRCHRSYVVNFDKVKVIRKGGDGLSLDFDENDIPKIPVSRTYSAIILDKFSNAQN